MLLGSTEAALMGNFTSISRRPAKCAMNTAWVHSGAVRAPLCPQGDVMAHFAGRREIGVKFPMRAASVDPNKNTTHAPDYNQNLITRPQRTQRRVHQRHAPLRAPHACDAALLCLLLLG